MTNDTTQIYISLLQKWVNGARKHVIYFPDRPELACYGTGEDTWGVQTNQKALAAFATVAADPRFEAAAAGISRWELQELALRMLRYSLQSHIEGDYHCTDNASWGHTWISVLGLERMMHGVDALSPLLQDADKTLLRKVLLSESDWLLDHYPIVGGLLAKDGHNKPESNLWNGAFMLRMLAMYTDCPRAEAYREKALGFLINGISVPSDAHDETVMDGKKIADRFVGANFFDTLSLNHHGYLNVGYMVICLSNMAMLHFMYRSKGIQAPEALYHHMKELWDVVKLCTFEDGRLLRIGGDTRVRYTYCQDYVLPVWHMIGDVLGDPDCARFEEGWLKQIELETVRNGDGTFLSERCGPLEQASPLYYTRLESDRAVALSMGLAWKRLVRGGTGGWKEEAGAALETAGKEQACASSPIVRDSSGLGWQDAYHGAYVHRSAKRDASWVWESAEKPQGLCLPAGASDMAEWRENLSPRLRGLGKVTEQRLEKHDGTMFDGGFITWGSTLVQTQGLMAEGQKDHPIARSAIACAALPDATHMIVIQYATAARRTYVHEVKGLNLLMPNDLFNGSERTYYWASGQAVLQGAGSAEETIRTGSRWVNVDDRLGIVAVYGTEGLSIHRPGRRQIGLKEKLVTAGSTGMLYADELCGPLEVGLQAVEAGQVIVDAAYVIQAGEEHESTRAYAAPDSTFVAAIQHDTGEVRAVRVKGADAHTYVLAANFGGTEATLALEAADAIDMANGQPVGSGHQGQVRLGLQPGSARLVRIS
ncbi:hypothetical protein ACFQI7_14255 [Paenibacillus allorhizosphaerae]|uniref:Alginate lyase domain-containing protein n=1 Tax=Paenibacillus allorhizosphaerae TaxID=2849866 RepID=A0ABM8VD19_9BACL|nr:hypothetical protein [Paenibacillus allorhizosphaerae]CAG7626239.1 hypothetical protein PAECIP111802_01230 [Paenibacillus allorhizosphaerae]